MSESDKIERFRQVLEQQLGGKVVEGSSESDANEVSYITNPVDKILDHLDFRNEVTKTKKTSNLMGEINQIQKRNEKHIVDLEKKIASILK